MTPDQIFAKYNGKQVLNKYGAQCEAWAERYGEELGHPIPTANAKDHTGNIAGYTWIPNTPELVPQKGDIVVWGTQVGQYGHIAVANGVGNTSTFQSYDQNWPLSENAQGYGTGSVHLQPHNYYGVLGVQRPQLGDNDMYTSPVSGGSGDAEYWGKAWEAEQAELVNAYKVLKETQDKVAELSQEVDSLHTQVAGLQKQLADASQRPPEPAEGTITSTSTLQTVVSFLKRLFNNA